MGLAGVLFGRVCEPWKKFYKFFLPTAEGVAGAGLAVRLTCKIFMDSYTAQPPDHSVRWVNEITKEKEMATRYLPRADSELLIWLDNYGKQLAAVGKSVGVDATEQKAQQALCAEIATAIQADEAAYANYRAAVAHSAEVKARALKTITSRIDHIDTHPACTDEIRAALRMVAPQAGSSLALSEHKVPLSVEGLPGRVVLKWKKGPLEGVNVYGQRGTETEWLLLGRDNRPPFEDLRPLAARGVPEVRRYRVVGVVADREVTPPSDTVAISIAD